MFLVEREGASTRDPLPLLVVRQIIAYLVGEFVRRAEGLQFFSNRKKLGDLCVLLGGLCDKVSLNAGHTEIDAGHAEVRVLHSPFSVFNSPLPEGVLSHVGHFWDSFGTG